jgi:hypothetical protein
MIDESANFCLTFIINPFLGNKKGAHHINGGKYFDNYNLHSSRVENWKLSGASYKIT